MKGHERKRALGECVNKLRLLESVAKRASESHWEQLTDEIQAAMERASLLLEAGDAELYNRSLNEVKELAAVAEGIEELARGQIDLVEIDQATIHQMKLYDLASAAISLARECDSITAYHGTQEAQGTADDASTTDGKNGHHRTRQRAAEETREELLRGKRTQLNKLIRRGIMNEDYTRTEDTSVMLYTFAVCVIWCGDKIDRRGVVAKSENKTPPGLAALLRLPWLAQYRQKLSATIRSEKFVEIYRVLNY